MGQGSPIKVTLLGCGTSVGVPALGHAGWGKCDPTNPKNRRQRCALLVQKEGFNLLVDAGPDIRNQLLDAGNPKIHAVLITHTHADHVAGMDDLRTFYWPDQQKIPIYGTAGTLDNLKNRFNYLFVKSAKSPTYFVPSLEGIEISPDSRIQIGGIDIKILLQHHGHIDSLGFVFDEKIGYSTDVVEIPNYNFQHLMNLDLWIVESLRASTHQAHAHFDLTFSWIERCQPKRAVLTHLGLEADYEETLALCPDRTEPGYDGQVFDIE
jgi:phosphoribosyl 1,2-cyclic phosphate phosphodiesterase